MRLLFLSPLCYPAASAEGIVTLNLVLALSEAGHTVDVFCVKGLGYGYPAEESFVPPHVKDRLHEIPVRGRGIITGASYVARATIAARRALRRHSYSAVVSRVMPAYGHLPALLLRHRALRRLPWIACWSDPLPLTKAPAPYGQGRDAPSRPWLSRYAQAVSRRASWHLFPSDRLRHYVCAYLPACKNKSSVLPHAGPGKWLPSDTQRFRTSPESESSQRRPLTISHTGSLVHRDPTVFLRGFRDFLRAEPESAPCVYLQFAGRPDPRLAESARQLGIERHLVQQGPQSYENSLALVHSGDIALVLEPPMREGIFLLAKAADAPSLGKPLLACSPARGTMADLVNAHGGGLAVDNTDPRQIARALATLYRSWRRDSLARDFPVDRLRHYFSPERVAAAFAGLVNCLVTGNERSIPQEL